jgi:hypothetical protein
VKNKCVVGVRIVSAIEFDEIGWNIVFGCKCINILLENGVNYDESKPVVGTKNTVNSILCWDSPQFIISNCVFLLTA